MTYFSLSVNIVNIRFGELDDEISSQSVSRQRSIVQAPRTLVFGGRWE
jgi:hypothetical protein